MKIYINSFEQSFTSARTKNQWCEKKPDTISNNPEDADIIWISDFRGWKNVEIELLKRKKVLCSISDLSKIKIYCKQNEIDFKNDFSQLDSVVDIYHVPNKYVKYDMQLLTLKEIKILEYWYESRDWQHFPFDKKQLTKEEALKLYEEKPKSLKSRIRTKETTSPFRTLFDIGEDVFVVGSFQEDSDSHGDPIMSKGPDIFYTYAESIQFQNSIKTDEEGNPTPIETLVLLSGTNRDYIKTKLSHNGIQYKHIENADHETMRKMYDCCDLYVSTIRDSGGPHTLYEACSMKTPVVSTRSAAAESILAPNCIQQIPNIIYIPTTEDIEQCYQNVQKYDIISHIDKYEEMFRSLYNQDGEG